MTSKSHFIPNFELRSLAVLAALSVGTALSAHAQTPGGGGAKPSAPTAAPSAQNTPARAAPVQNADAIFVRADVNKDGKLI